MNGETFIAMSEYGRLFHIASRVEVGETVWMCGAKTAHASTNRTPLALRDEIDGLEGADLLCTGCRDRHNKRAYSDKRRVRKLAGQLPALAALAVRQAFGTERLDLPGSAEERAFEVAAYLRGMGSADLIAAVLSDERGEVLR